MCESRSKASAHRVFPGITAFFDRMVGGSARSWRAPGEIYET